MARLLLEEGREVVALVDGDEGGKKLKKNLEKLNAQIEKTSSSLKPVIIIELSDNESIEDLLPQRSEYFGAVVAAATLGRHVEKVSKSWFKEPDPISKLAIARNYISWLEARIRRNSGSPVCPLS